MVTRPDLFWILRFLVFALFWIWLDRRFVQILRSVRCLEERIANLERRFVPPGF